MKLTKTPCSTDALYIDNSSDFYFIEFKNGKMSQSKIYNVYNKIYFKGVYTCTEQEFKEKFSFV